MVGSWSSSQKGNDLTEYKTTAHFGKDAISQQIGRSSTESSFSVELPHILSLFLEKINSSSHSFLKCHLWFPPQDALGLAVIEIGQVDIAWTLGSCGNWSLKAGNVSQRLVDLVARNGLSGSNTKEVVISM